MFVTTAYAATDPAAEGEAHTEAGAEHGASGVFPPFDPTYFASQLLWLAITFGLFYLLLKRVILPRLAGILDARRDRIAADLDEAGRMKSEADAAVAAYEQELTEARAKAGAIAQQARDGAKTEAETARKAIEADLEKKLSAAESRIAEIKASAMNEVGNIAEQTTQAIVEQLVGGNVSKSDVAAAVAAARK
ncbi:MAG: F0F1 ATP synthase subunit B [Rhizobiaceae bacterium]